MSEGGTGRLRHVPALDGLRGLALLGVLFFHANGALPGGYLGVDLFFVLSGFLITSLLLAEHRATGKIALSTFWIRRARRLFPALLSLMPAIAVYGWFFAKPGELAGLRADALATLGYVANWRAVFSHKSYWQLFAAPSPLEHTWSLSIEEQFYVVWPLVVMLVLRRRSPRIRVPFGPSAGFAGPQWILALTVLLSVASAIAMLALYRPGTTSRVYLGTDTRATSILAGAALATLLSPNTTFRVSTVRKLDVLGIASALGIGFAWWKLVGVDRFLYRGGFWLTELAALVLITCACMGKDSIVARVLSFRPLTLVGTISYGLYLWHWPVNVVLTSERVHLHGAMLHAVQFAVTFAIAIVSYRFLERPIRMRGLPFGRPHYIVPAAVALAVLLVVRATYARPLPPSSQMPSGPQISLTTDPVRFRIMVLGDSTANSLGWCLRGVHETGVAVDLMGYDGCTMFGDMCGGSVWGQQAKELHPNATLVFLGGAFLHGLTIDDQWVKACTPGWDEKFKSTLTQRLGDLQTTGIGKVWAATIPYPLGPYYDNAQFRGETDCINASIRSVTASLPGVHLLDVQERLCPKGVCQREYKGVEIRPDGVHYTISGAAGLSAWVLEQLERPDPP